MMMHADFFQKLDNPAWYALAETHQPYAVGNSRLKHYQKDIVSFFAYDHAEENALSELDGFTDAGESFLLLAVFPHYCPITTSKPGYPVSK